MRNKTTAALLAFFLGGFGGQYFYLGRVAAGIACILFCWTLIPCFIAFYHFIKFLTMSEEAFNLEYNAGYVTATSSAQLAASMKQVTQQLATAAPVQPKPQSQPATRTMTNVAPAAAPQISLTEELERLFQLKEKGALTEEEYLVRKAKLLA
jgi:TM2 domain-containing membrane protein YozV